MNSSPPTESNPPPLPPTNRGFAFVLVTCLIPAGVGMAVSFVVPEWWTNSTPLCWVVGATAALPAWAAWNLHRRRKAAGINIFSHGWLAAGAGILGAVVLSALAVVLSVVVVFLVILASCCVTGGKIGG